MNMNVNGRGVGWCGVGVCFAGDGELEIVLGTSLGFIYVMHASDGALHEGFPLTMAEIQAQVRLHAYPATISCMTDLRACLSACLPVCLCFCLSGIVFVFPEYWNT